MLYVIFMSTFCILIKSVSFNQDDIKLLIVLYHEFQLMNAVNNAILVKYGKIYIKGEVYSVWWNILFGK